MGGNRMSDHYMGERRGTWRECADKGDTYVWVPEGADGAKIERNVRGTAYDRYCTSLAADEALGRGPW
jgi:hypothetical protein